MTKEIQDERTKHICKKLKDSPFLTKSFEPPVHGHFNCKGDYIFPELKDKR